MKIAVVENNGSSTESIFGQGYIACFSDESGKWLLIDRFENTVYEAQSIADVRNELKKIVNKLDGVKIIVASEISGVAFSVFEGAGFEIFTVDAKTSEILDKTKKEMEEIGKEQSQNARSANIQLYIKRGMNRGDYFLNLIELLSENPQSTTKSVLIPYLKEGDFERFDVVCGHIPPWFDKEFAAMGLKYDTVNVLPDKKTVRITHIA